MGLVLYSINYNYYTFVLTECLCTYVCTYAICVIYFQLKDMCAQNKTEKEVMKQELEALTKSKEDAVRAVQEQMAEDTKTLKCQYLLMCQKLLELNMSYKEVAEEYKQLKSLSKQFPQLLSKNVMQVKKEVG